MNKVKTSDFLIIGGGIIGLSLARQLKKEFSDAKIIVLEKEADCGLRASGRNSGVLHAGFYYSRESLKAKFTKIGNQRLAAYCEEKKLNINKCGKLVIARNQNDLIGLDELLKRGRDNGVQLHSITEKEAKEIEPRVLTYQRAIFSPTTFSVDPAQVIHALKEDAISEGIEIHCHVKYLKRNKNGVLKTSAGLYETGYLINASGLYADQIARDFNFSKNHRILPFKGVYLYSHEPRFSVKTHVYPVPDLKNPFLGVHFTVNVNGQVKIGPTAIPAFWREQYQSFERFELKELFDISMGQAGLLFYSNFDFKKLAWEEIRKYSRSRLVKLAATMLNGVALLNYQKFGKPGIRAQLLNIKNRKLEMDFVLEGDGKSMHILNAVSPGFTSSFPFAEFVCEKIKEKIVENSA